MTKRLIALSLAIVISLCGHLSASSHAQTLSEAAEASQDAGPYKKELEADFSKVVKYGEAKIENIEMETFKRDMARLHQDSDRLTLINYWASWCAFCYMEFQPLRKLADDHPEMVKIIYVGDTKNGYKEFTRISDKANLPQDDNFYDSRNFVRNWINVRTYPTTLLVSPDGKILYRFEGNGEWNSEYMRNFLKSIYDTTKKPSGS
ncbi:MAG: TlpA disulfide reductase family protein [Pseudobdellovibrionaceae bacterium]|jgi:thiol-disulfide isomerase/thioredoxin|nr:TlpA disulfide reductase family protein [Pseudobdellovibrionaceae bacterium]